MNGNSFDEEDMDRRHLKKAVEARKVLEYNQELIIQLQDRLQQTSVSRDKYRLRAKELSTACILLENQNHSLQSQFSTVDQDLVQVVNNVARLQQDNSRLETELNTSRSKEEDLKNRIRVLESTCQANAEKLALVSHTNLVVLKENFTLKQEVDTLQRDSRDDKKNWSNQIDLLKHDLHLKTAQLFEMENQFRGAEFKFEQDLLALERNAELSLTEANEHTREAHRILAHREKKALLALRAKSEWKHTIVHLQRTNACLRVQRNWHSEMLGALVLPHPIKNYGPNKFKTVAMAIVFIFLISKARRRSCHTTVDVLSAGTWRHQDIASASLELIRAQRLGWEKSFATIQSLQIIATQHSALELALKEHQEGIHQIRQVNKELMEENRVLHDVTSHAAQQEKELKCRVKQWSKRCKEIEEAYLDVHAVNRDLDSLVKQLQEELAQLSLRFQELSVQSKLDQSQRIEVELECQTLKEMLERAQRYAEAEIASLSRNKRE